MRKFPFPRIHGPDHDLCIRSIEEMLKLYTCDAANFDSVDGPTSPRWLAMSFLKPGSHLP